MLLHTFDKLLFTAAFIAALQVPAFFVQYGHQLRGELAELEVRVTQYQALAKAHGFRDVYAMLETLNTNSEPSVVADAALKLDTLNRKDALTQAVAKFNGGTFFAQAGYVLMPKNWHRFERVARFFTPSITLNASAWLGALIGALVLNLLWWLPIKLIHRLTSKQTAYRRG